jgi:O-6-methylguanine DNA methyltransferase
MHQNKNTGSLYICHSVVNFSITAFQWNENSAIVTELKLFPQIIEPHKKGEGQNTVYESLLKYATMIQQFLDGKIKDLSSIPIQLEFFTPFQQHVLTAARCIAYGNTVSYSKLAEIAGNKNAVRAVASVMRKNRYPIIIPCHRIIRSNGEIGGYSGQQNGKAIALKRKLLSNEGVVL